MTPRQFPTYRLLFATCFALTVGSLLAGEATAQDEASAKPADDAALKQVRLVLHDGSILVGEMKIESIKVDTKFGQLTVPVEQLQGFRPGLANQPERQAKLQALIEQLEDADEKKQAAAKQELTRMGPEIRDQLRAAMANDKSKRNAQLDAILTALDSQAESDEDAEQATLIADDTVDTTDFTIVGKIVPSEFTLTNRWGTLKVKIEDIAQARWGGRQQMEDQHKSLTLTGEYLAQLKFKSTGIQVNKGDRIIVRADGMISRSGSSSYRSTPAGVSRFGTYQSSPLIYGGTLVARLGGGKVFKVGDKATIVADRDGILRFAIAMRPDYVGRYQFPGQYNVKTRVERGRQ